MATDRLKIYNGALLICGERALASLTEEREPRRLLDSVWQDGGVRYCIEMGQWRFATRASKLSYETAIDPQFGYRRAFAKPTDWVNTNAICSDERYQVPILGYNDETAYIFCDLDEIYVKYVSDDEDYGGNLALWPVSFTEFVKAHFAAKIIRKLPGGKEKVDDICHPRTGVEAQAMLTAKNKDAQKDPTKFPAPGSWVTSRLGRIQRRGPMGDGGSSGSLTG